MQLLREGKAGSGDFSAADEASRKLLRSLIENRAEAKQGTSGQAFYGKPRIIHCKPYRVMQQHDMYQGMPSLRSE